MEPSALMKEIRETIKNDPIFKFAKINSKTHIVENTVIISESTLQNDNNFLDNMVGPGENVYWIKCEKDQYMNIGETYNSTLKRCIVKQTNPHYILNANGDWVPPIPKPDDINHNYVWDDFLEEWIIIDPPASPLVWIPSEPPVDMPPAPFVGYSTS